MIQLSVPLPVPPEEYINSEVLELCNEIECILSEFSQKTLNNSARDRLIVKSLEENVRNREVNGAEIFAWSHLYEHSDMYTPNTLVSEFERKKYVHTELMNCFDHFSVINNSNDIILASKAVFSKHNTNEVRIMEMASSRDITGNRVKFIQASEVQNQLTLLRSKITMQYPLHSVFKAIYALHTLLIIHPFHDGNGRTSRGLFNYLLVRDGITLAPVVPLGIYRIKSKSFFEVCSRYTYLNSEISMLKLVKFFYSIIWDLHNNEFTSNDLFDFKHTRTLT